MAGIKQQLAYCATAAVVAALFAQYSSAQGAKPPVKIAGDFDKVHVLEPGGPAPRTADGHPDLSGRYYPNHAGRMLQGAYRIDRTIMRQFDPVATPQEDPVFRTDVADKYLHPTPYGSCPPGGTPTSITTQATEHGPMELIQVPGRLWILSEFPQTIRMIPTDGRPHSKDPDYTFNGESVAHWEGDTLVVDTVNFNDKTWIDRIGHPHSDQLHVVERFRRTAHDHLVDDITIEDAKAYTKPWTTRLEFKLQPTWRLTEQFCEDYDNFKPLEEKEIKPVK
jgi:hypothetical protein